jgi:hypothetical protein
MTGVEPIELGHGTIVSVAPFDRSVLPESATVGNMIVLDESMNYFER